MYLRRISPLIVFAHFLLPITSWAAGDGLTLYQAYQETLARSPMLSGAQATLNGSAASIKQVQSQRLPRLRFISEFNRGDDPVYVFGSLLRQGQFSEQFFSPDYLNNPPDRTNFRNALEAAMPIFTGFDITDRDQMARAGKTQSEAAYKGAETETTLQLLKSFITALLKAENAQVLEDRMESARKELESAEKLMKRGLVLGSDYYAARAILFGFEAQLAGVKAELEGALSRIKILTGQDSRHDVQVFGALKKPTYSLPTPEDLLSKIHDRPDFKMAESESVLAKKSLDMEKKTIIPKLDAIAALETNTEDFESNPSHHMVGVRLNALFGDPTYGARKAQAQAAREAADSKVEALRDESRIQILALLESYEKSAQALGSLINARDNAQKSLEMFRPLYREGRQSVLDVLKAEDALAKSELIYRDTLAGQHLTYAQIQAAVGNLNSETVRGISENLE